MKSTFPLRSFLFIPAGSSKILGKIEELKPDAFILDLEDSVPVDQKEQARKNIIIRLDAESLNKPLPPLFIRINDLDTPFAFDDVEMTCHPMIRGYVIPKFESELKALDLEKEITKSEKRCSIPEGTLELIFQVESMLGLKELHRLSSPSVLRRLRGIAFGGEDFSSSLSSFSDISTDMLDFARKMIVFHAKSFDVLAIDTVYKNFRDVQGIKNESERIVRMGFDAKLAIHPNQIKPINEAFSPSAEELERVKVILDHQTQIGKDGAINMNGVMLDCAHLKWAQKAHSLWLKESE